MWPRLDTPASDAHGRNVTVRLASTLDGDVDAAVQLKGMRCAAPLGTLWVLSSGGNLTADNPPFDPDRYAPVKSRPEVDGTSGTPTVKVTLPKQSFSVLVATCEAEAME